MMIPPGLISKNVRDFVRCVLYCVLILLFVLLIGCTSATPTLAPTPAPTMGATDMAKLGMDFDIEKAVLIPTDVSDLFPTTGYSIGQSIGSPDMYGSVLTYPTQIIEHTSAFAQGFSTRIEVYRDVDKATRAFDTAAQQQHGKSADADNVADATRVFSGTSVTPEGSELTSTEYVALVRQRNVLVTITIRTERQVPGTRLTELARLVLSRLKQ